MNIRDKIKAYEEVLEVISANKDLFKEDRVEISESSLSNFIENLQVSELFNIPLAAGGHSYKYLTVGGGYFKQEHIKLTYYGEDLKRSISWSDNGKQPQEEWLMTISFPTGAYIFGDSYPTETFKAFWEELKAFKPKYSDTVNHCLYFTEETAKDVYSAYNNLYEKYRELVQDEVKEQRKKKLQEELASLDKE